MALVMQGSNGQVGRLVQHRPAHTPANLMGVQLFAECRRQAELPLVSQHEAALLSWRQICRPRCRRRRGLGVCCWLARLQLLLCRTLLLGL